MTSLKEAMNFYSHDRLKQKIYHMLAKASIATVKCLSVKQ